MRNRSRVAALGGGHGLSASLQALQLVTDNITAIVTVADDGGSSGRLREEFDILPPGDLRMALAALCDNSEWGLQWADALQHRFAGDGPLGGHALGLGETSAISSAVMWPTYVSRKLSLAPDDIAGIRSIYSGGQPRAA